MTHGLIKVVKAKMHGLKVTGADLSYHGSITLDPGQCFECGLLPLEFVEIWNKSSGARISTYVIYGAEGSRCCVLNGAAARTCQVGDEVIIAGFSFIEPSMLGQLSPTVLTFDAQNHIRERIQYRVTAPESGPHLFEIILKDKGSGSDLAEIAG